MPHLKIWLSIASWNQITSDQIMKSNYLNVNSLTMYVRFLKFDILLAKTIMWRFNCTCNNQKFSIYHCQDISVDPDIAVNVWQVLGVVDAIHSHMEVLEQGVGIAIQLQDYLPHVGHPVWGIEEFVDRPEVEGVVQTVSYQCVVTVTLEVVFLAVKGDIVRVTPDLAETRSCRRTQYKLSSRTMLQWRYIQNI